MEEGYIECLSSDPRKHSTTYTSLTSQIVKKDNWFKVVQGQNVELHIIRPARIDRQNLAYKSLFSSFFFFFFFFLLLLSFLLYSNYTQMTSAVQLLRDQVAKELQGSVTIIGKSKKNFFCK
jgi:ATP-dependent Zn protease